MPPINQRALALPVVAWPIFCYYHYSKQTRSVCKPIWPLRRVAAGTYVLLPQPFCHAGWIKTTTPARSLPVSLAQTNIRTNGAGIHWYYLLSFSDMAPSSPDTLPWEDVKTVTLWGYEQLHHKLAAVMAFPVIRHHYNVPLAECAVMARSFFPHADLAAGEYPAEVLNAISQLEQAGIQDWASFLQATNSRAKLAAFLNSSQMSFAACVSLFNYLLRFGLPFLTPSRQLIDETDPLEIAWHKALKARKLMHTFDLLQLGALPQQRQWLAGQINLPPVTITRLVHRADLARIPYVRQRTLLPLSGAGYCGIAALAAATPTQANTTMQAYFASQGKSWADMKKVITLPAIITWAKALPQIVIDESSPPDH